MGRGGAAVRVELERGRRYTATIGPHEQRHDAGADDVDPDANVTAAMNAVRHIVRALRISSRASEKALGVSAAQLFVLQQLADGAAGPDGAPSIAHLAQLTATDPSSVSVVVSRLVARGLAARRPSRLDGRRAEVAITPAGRALLRRAPPPIQEGMISALAEMAPPRRRELVAGLEAIVASLGASDQAASMFFEEEGERPDKDDADLDPPAAR